MRTTHDDDKQEQTQSNSKIVISLRCSTTYKIIAPVIIFSSFWRLDAEINWPRPSYARRRTTTTSRRDNNSIVASNFVAKILFSLPLSNFGCFLGLHFIIFAIGKEKPRRRTIVANYSPAAGVCNLIWV